MELIKAINSRRSIRGYKSLPVPKATLIKILEIATRAPSALNSQPWEFIILGGTVWDNLKLAIEEQYKSGATPNRDFPMKPLTGVYRQRQVELGVSLYQLLGIGREDTEKKTNWMLKMVHAFDAPNVIIVSIDEEISCDQSMFNLGLVSQNIALMALEYGLGTCIMGALLDYPDIVRKITDIPSSKKLAIAIAIGYPDLDFPANKLITERESLENIVTWQGVDQ